MYTARFTRKLLILAATIFGCVSAHAFAAPATTTQLSLSSTSVKQGTAITLRAAVLAGSTPVTEGQVLFCETTHLALCTPASANVLGLAQIAPSGSASYSLRLGVGTHILVARFVGTTGYAASSSASGTVTVQPLAKSPLQVTLTATAVNEQTQQGLYNLSAAVTTTGGGPAATGTVTFQVASPHATMVLGTPTLTASSAPLSGYGPAPSSPNGKGNPVVADWNEDGIPDLALIATAGNGVAVLPGAGDGSFAAPSPANTVPGLCAGSCVAAALATADFNSDGHADLVVLYPAGSGYALQFAYGKGDGSFQVGAPVAVALTPGLGAPQLVVGDYNGDGQPDLVVNGTVASTGAGFAVALQQADHTFAITYPTSFGSAGVTPTALLKPADVNSDGKTDLVGLSSKLGIVTLVSNGNGTFTGEVIGGANGTPDLFALGDFNADGFVDVVVFTQPNYVSLGTPLFNDGHGSFTAGGTLVVDFPPSTNLLSVDAVDANGDGIADIFLTELDEIDYSGQGLIQVLGLLFTSNGTGGFTETSSYLPSELPNQLETSPLIAADLNGDGLLDVVYPQGAACCVVLLNRSNGGSSLASLGNVQMPAGGAAGLSLTAAYGGDTRYLAATSPATSVDGTPVPTTLQLTAIPSTVPAGGSVTVTATLAPSLVQGYSTDGETVDFYINTQHFSSTLHGGTAVLSTSQLPVGQYQVVAAYEGDGVFVMSTSSPQPVVVTPAGPGDGGLHGSYVFHYSGTGAPGRAGADAEVAGVGVLSADGMGGIGGEEDTNSAGATIAGSYLSGGYSLNSNGTGTLHLVNDHGVEQDFVIALSSRDSTTGVAAAFTLMGIGPSGEVIAGRAVAQPAAYTSTQGFLDSLSGTYTLSLTGKTACTGTGVCAGTTHQAGAVSAIGSILFSNGGGTGPVVENLAGAVGLDPAVLFTFPSADGYGRTVLTVKSTAAPADQPTHYVGYYATSGEMFVMSSDPHASSMLLNGSIEKQ